MNKTFWNVLKHLTALRATRASQCFTGVIAYTGKIFESYAAVILLVSIFYFACAICFSLFSFAKQNYNQSGSTPKMIGLTQ